MKRILSLILTVLLLITLVTGCNAPKRELYSVKLSKYITVGDYKGIEVDTSSNEYKNSYEDILYADVQAGNYFKTLTEGTVSEGDTVNIDYVGKKDGVAFNGGTAKGYDLKIGSGTFIDGFEEGIIGEAIGSTFDLNLTFPKNYGNEELNGAKVVFTVTVNYVTTDDPLSPSEYYKDLNFKSLKEYEADARERAIKNLLVQKFTESCEIKKYPQDTSNFLCDKYIEAFEKEYLASAGYTIDAYIEYLDKTEDEFREEIINNNIKPQMDTQMPLYALLDDADMEVTSDDINAKAEEMAKAVNNSSVTTQKIKEYYGNYYIEYLVVNKKAVDYMYKYAKIK